jgi:putative glutamine amidotransferase
LGVSRRPGSTFLTVVCLSMPTPSETKTHNSKVRPLIAIPLRFSESASALRYQAEVASRNLVEAVWAAGGEPLMVHPTTDEIEGRLKWADGVLLPGGGDLAGGWSGQSNHPTLYDVDETQDACDLALARYCLASGLPLLAVCRGQQVVNVALGGTLIQDMVGSGDFLTDHRHKVHDVKVEPTSQLHKILGPTTVASCYHHQCLGELGTGLVPTAYSSDGVIEAVELAESTGSPKGRPTGWPRSWFVGVQWHPEDTWDYDPAQLALFRALVSAAQGAQLS